MKSFDTNLAKKSKKVLFVDLAKRCAEAKSFPDLNSYVGGVGIGLKLWETYGDLDPVIFSVGPLNGFFPFASKTSVVLDSDGVPEDLYIGGGLSFRIRFCDLDSIVIHGTSSHPVTLEIQNEEVKFHEVTVQTAGLGLPGKRSVLKFGGFGSAGESTIADAKNNSTDDLILDGYFLPPEDFLKNAFRDKRLFGMVVTGLQTFTVDDFEKYQEIYTQILQRAHEVDVEQSTGDKPRNPSCAGCPLGCPRSKVGELGGNVMVHSLVACEYAQKIYSDVGIVFSCLNTLGYNYTHEDLENLPNLIERVLKNQ